MVKYTPGGARNFLVPSRLQPRQVLRARREPAALQAALHGGGVRPLLPDRQVLPRRGPAPRPPARVHPDRRRDEFVNQDDIFRVIEGLIFEIWKEVLGVDLTSSIRAALPADAVRRVDGPLRQRQARYPLRPRHVDLTDLIIEHGGGGVPFWKPIADKFASGEYRRDLPAEIVKAHRASPPKRAKLSRAELDGSRSSSRAWAPRASRAPRSTPRATGSSRRSPRRSRRSSAQAINAAAGRDDGDLLLFQFGRESAVQTVLANLRSQLGEEAGADSRDRPRRQVELPLGREPSALRVRRGEEDAGSLRTTPSRVRTTTASRCSRPTRAKSSAGVTTWCSTASRSAAGRIRLHDPAGAGQGVPRARHLGRGGARQVRLPARGAEARRAAARGHRARDGPARDAADAAPRACAT